VLHCLEDGRRKRVGTFRATRDLFFKREFELVEAIRAEAKLLAAEAGKLMLELDDQMTFNRSPCRPRNTNR
tara:strand:- start:330 stop:542 length:213 start_codon:yes stop_codon:yes gene_type:complete